MLLNISVHVGFFFKSYLAYYFLCNCNNLNKWIWSFYLQSVYNKVADVSEKRSWSNILLSCDLKVLQEVAPSGHNADLNAGTSGSAAATSPVCKEEAEMRAALQFLMRHMVKRAVMRSPIKRALGLADLERAQAMIYKLVVNGLLEEPSGGKTKPGENMET